MIANARMYAVTPEVETAWRGLLAHIADDAGITLEYVTHAAPQPLEALWSRSDLGAVVMCGFPLATTFGEVEPLAAPIPSSDWAHGSALYRSDLIVRADAPFRSLTDTFGHRLGWTTHHSHSGFNALRHHLLGYRSDDSPTLYAEVIGNLNTPRGVLEAVLDETIDVGPLDAYWHALMARVRPDLVAGIRVVDSTDLAPMPAFVASARMERPKVEALRKAFDAAAGRPWFADYRDILCLRGFERVDRGAFAPMLAWDRQAKASGYPDPA